MKFIMLLLLAGSFLPASAQKYVREHSRNIIGTWVSEDGEWKFVFTPVICKEYHGKSLSNIYQYKISADSVQCGEKLSVNVEQRDDYLQLTGLADGVKVCFLINAVDKKTLSLSDFMQYRPTVFVRQKE